MASVHASPLCLVLLATATAAPMHSNALASETVADSFDTAPVWKRFWSRADRGFAVRQGRSTACAWLGRATAAKIAAAAAA